MWHSLEPATQMSALGTTQVIVQKPDNTIFKGKISDLIDPLCKDSNEMVSEVVDIKGYKILGVDQNNEKNNWNEISQISRHPANGRLVKVTTKSGKTTTATLSHSFLKRKEDGIIPVLGSDLKLGDRIPICKYTPEVKNPLFEYGGFKLTKDFGWFIGAYLSDGSINSNRINISKIIPEYSNKVIEFAKYLGNKAKYTYTPKDKKNVNSYGSEGKTSFSDKKLSNFLVEYFGKGSENKQIAPFVFQSNKNFISGILSGYFDGDGNINSILGKQTIRSLSKSEQLTSDIIILLSYFGIFASKCKEKNIYHTVQISKKYAKTFKENIGLIVKEKYESLKEIVKYTERENIHSNQEIIDKIPELGNILASVGKTLKLPSRLYGRYINKESIGRSTLIKYINEFEKHENVEKVQEELKILKQAAYSDVVWDEITSLEILDDPKECVYDFTVPGNESFMVDCNIFVHNTLNTFHYAGVSAKNVTLGVPRLKELINVTRKLKTPSLTMYDDNSVSEYNQVGQKRIMENVRSNIEYKTIQDILISSDIIKESDEEYQKDANTINLFKKLYAESESPIPKDFLSLRLEFNSKDLEYVDTSMIKLANSIEETIGSDYKIICSDDNDENDNLFIRIITNHEDHAKANYLLRKVEIQCMNIKIKGYEGIEKVYIREGKYNQFSEEKGHYTDKQWIFETEGSNMLDTFTQEKINHNKTISNNIIEIYEILGIEAARQSLLNELKMVLSFDGSYVNYRHLEILVDTMTARGQLTSVTRHGLNRGNTDSGPLTKSTFEETVEVLTEAAAFGEYDPLKGVSDNIMFGQTVPCGTGVFDVLYDLEVTSVETRPPTRENTPGLIIPKFIPSEPDYDIKSKWPF